MKKSLSFNLLSCALIVASYGATSVTAGEPEKTPEPDVELVKIYTQETPAMRFIGKKYRDEDRVNGGFGTQWNEWHKNGWFTKLDAVCKAPDFEDGDAAIGLMRWHRGEAFEYWVGKFFVENTAVPEGFEHADFPASTLGIGWLRGRDGLVYMKEGWVAEALGKEGKQIATDEQNATWFFERYAGKRFIPDEAGNIILDIGFFVKKEEVRPNEDEIKW